MKKPVSLYFLYCVNMQCQFSVYQLMVEHRIPMTPENLGKTHTCHCCHKPLVSALNMNARSIVTETKSKMLFTPDYVHN
ncbi:MAG: hypothetical protein ACXVB0_11210 [Mucilaginibacter sp.]